MAKTFDPNRIRPGTIELVRAADGTYSTKVVGLESINSLSLPEISTTATTTKTDTDTKTATDITGDTLKSQTQMAFKTGGDNQVDTTGSMLQDEAEKTSSMLSDTFSNTRALMTSNEAYRGVTSPLEIKDPTEKFSTARKEMTQDDAYRQGIEDFKNYQDGILRGQIGTKAAVQRGEIEPPGIDFSFLGGDRFKQGTPFTDAAAREAMTTDEAMGDETKPSMLGDTGGSMNQMSGALGISADPTQSATRAAKEAGFASGSFPGRTVTDSDLEADAGTKARTDIKPEAKKTFAESVNTVLKNVASLSPVGAIMRAVGKPVGESVGAVAHNKNYFNANADGRISGNPAKDLYAGFNRTSKFGNLSRAGAKRLETRQKTIERKGYKPGDKFYDDTEKMKGDQKNYNNSLKNAPVTGTTKPGEKGGSEATGGKIVCTMMNQRYGFGSFRNKIWLRFHKDYSPEYQKGYHKVFLPLVNIAKKEGIFNTIVRKILEHMGRHVTADMFQVMRNKKSDKLGRIYRKIFEPICYWLGGK